MFYSDGLRNAIDEALRDSKLVACFITDNGDESQLWENDFLQDQRIKRILSDQSVLLRLEAGSEEAGFLAAIFPIPKTPTFVLIEGGNLKEYITPGVLKDDFCRRLISIFVPNEKVPSAFRLPQLGSAVPGEDEFPAQSTSTVKTSHVPKAKEDGGNAAQEPKIESQAHNPTTQLPSFSQNYALLQKKLQDQDERARILKRVEDDKKHRRTEAARRKAERQISNSNLASDSAKISCPPNSSPLHFCSLLIRLFDGSTIRSKFHGTATLSNEVRTFISQHQPEKSHQPYIFKHILSPSSNHTIEATEETLSLQELGCFPNTTFILAPVKVYSEVYSKRGVGAVTNSFIGGLINNGLRMISGGLSMVVGTLSAAVGSSSTDERAEGSQRNDNRNRSAPSNTSTSQLLAEMSNLEERNRMDEQQFYNGNSVNFQPRLNDHDEEKKQD
ncbi:putative ubx domain-containing protein [Golovinomyces cichoracearum]|uniref:Putative ubx domain-containing protein n=1 Tax=Golovinomyces cichoracearum TaxID=62708 RepID=A0A420IJP3_9PEZI|nr:putative ubx domain-containing protein [Golovinomyces cichoracearum]